MSTLSKSTTTTISLITLVLSLAVVSPSTAIAKGSRRTANSATSQYVQNLGGRNKSLSGSALRSASGTLNPKRGAIAADGYEGTSIRRTNQMFHGTSGDGEKFRMSLRR